MRLRYWKHIWARGGAHPAAARHLVLDNTADWSGLSRKVEKSIQTRLIAATEDRLYRDWQLARIQGRPAQYLFPFPRPEVTPSHTEGVFNRVRDFLSTIIKEAIVPALYAHTGKAVSTPETDQIRERLFAAAPYRQLIETSEKWHEPRRSRRLRADLQCVNPAFEKGWLPIVHPIVIPQGTVFEGQSIAGLRFIPYTKSSQLTAESEEMGHCVYAYVGRCIESSIPDRGLSHILSLREGADTRVSTVELLEKGTGKTAITSGQNKTYNDAVAPDRALAAGNWLVKGINDGTIPQVSTPEEREVRRQELRNAEAERMAQIANDPVLLQMTYDTVRRAVFPQAWQRFRTPVAFLEAILPDMMPTSKQPDQSVIQAMLRSPPPAPEARAPV